MADSAKITAILEQMREGTSLRKCCEAEGVAVSTFLRWVEADKALADHYADARARMLDAHAEALEEIGDEAARAETAVEVAGLRLKSDNRKWLLSKLAPKKYGDRLELDANVTVRTLSQELSELNRNKTASEVPKNAG